jgi:hypothetical protein
MKKWLVAAFLCVIVGCSAIVSLFWFNWNGGFEAEKNAREKAYNYLVHSYNSTLRLCYATPGSNVYWLSHDNVLASYVLQQWNRTVADNITDTIRRIAQEYSLNVSEEGLPLDCKMEALFGYYVDFYKINNTKEATLNVSYYGSVLKTEETSNSSLNFTNYADMLCYASLVEWRRQNYSGADYFFDLVKKLWDGNGFRNVVYDDNHTYATYKLGLFYFLSQTLGISFDFKKELIERIWSSQDNATGGFMTDYYGNGTFPTWATTNTETTSIILLARIPTSLSN